MPRNEAKRLSEIEKRLESTSKENTTLKRLLGEEGYGKPSVADKVKIASKWIARRYRACLILDFVGLTPSTYYGNISRQDKPSVEHEESAQEAENNQHGRPIPGYSLDKSGRKVSDEQIKEWLNELVCGDGFPYGYRKLTVCLKKVFGDIVEELGMVHERNTG